MKKTKRKIHIGNDIWYYWVGSGRWREATHVTICSPDEQYYRIDANEVASSEIHVGAEGCFPTQILPSKVKYYIENKIENIMGKYNVSISENKIKSVLFGVAVGDALGVPVEFNSRQVIKKKPVTDMVGYGTYNLPSGTFSDDSSLTFCLAEALTNEFDLNAIGQNFVKWYLNSYWTPRGKVFDVGAATAQAIHRLSNGERPDLAGGFDVTSNGNGSLMRISPLLFYLLDKPIDDRYEITKQVSSITHGHIRSVIACFYYLEFARQLFMGEDKFEIYENLKIEVSDFLTTIPINQSEVAIFDRLLKGDIYKLTEEKIFSSGYVLHTLEASIWCLLTTNTYEDAVLKAVNLGNDTDTTGAVTGGLAGLLYGINSIPTKWLKQLARHDDIENLAERLSEKFTS
jgi:ADP-ribosyl-[dinitrogen reductase] hydrolase